MNKTLQSKWCVLDGNYSCWDNSSACSLHLFNTLDPSQMEDRTIEDATIVIGEEKVGERVVNRLVITGKVHRVESFKRIVLNRKSPYYSGNIYGDEHDEIIEQEDADRLRKNFVLKDDDIYEFQPTKFGFAWGEKVLMIKSGKYFSKNPKTLRMEWTNKEVQFIKTVMGD